MAESIEVQVVYALPERQDMVALRLPADSTLQTALESSGLLRKYPEIDLGSGSFGIYARIAKPDTLLHDRDRVEIYRQLVANPKETRRRRAAASKR